MPVLSFAQVSSDDNRGVGGKAWGLAVLSNAKFPVPPGIVLTAPPSSAERAEILSWWQQSGRPQLAIRSSAAAEDSAETSFAGQNRSFLNVSSPAAIDQAIQDCFDSAHREASAAYRQHFIGNGGAGQMNVVLQQMVEARFAGVFFSRDPRGSSDWVLEVIRGLGEDLVSGKTTPGRVLGNGNYRDLPEGFTIELAREIALIGERVEQVLHFPVDMEWAVDKKGEIFVLQARPITTLSKASEQNVLKVELEKIKNNHSKTTTWDGQTFAEWSGLPSPFTFSLWSEAFSPHHAFGDALQELGYVSFNDKDFKPGDSLLENIFGRAFINLERMSDLYYGPIPYTIISRPRPHTKFDWRKVSFAMFTHMPKAIASMTRVALNVSTRRREWLVQSAEALEIQKKKFRSSADLHHYKDLTTEVLHQNIVAACELFTRQTLRWPLLLVILTESTIQSLRIILKSITNEQDADRQLREWMSVGIHTVTIDMSNELQAACENPLRRPKFTAEFGHRGPGEMDLINPRWSEYGDQAFQKSSLTQGGRSVHVDIETTIKAMKTFKRDMILDEWKLFKTMLELREKWKMEILKPYAEIRFMLQEWGRRTGFNENVHWLTLHEVSQNAFLQPADVTIKMTERKKTAKIFKSLSLPEVLDLEQLAAAIEGKPLKGSKVLNGEPLSPGIAYGEVRFVEDPSLVNVDEWPERVILVAQSTDPGWTPLFLRAKGIVVERGGVLSHCAIVAREMSIPAVSGVLGIHSLLKDGQQIWVDGNTGHIRREENVQ